MSKQTDAKQIDVDKNRCDELVSAFQLFQPSTFGVDGVRETTGKKEILLSWRASTKINIRQV